MHKLWCDYICKVLTYNQPLCLVKSPPKFPSGSGATGVPGLSTMWLGALHGPQLSIVGTVMTALGGEARGGRRLMLFEGLPASRKPVPQWRQHPHPEACWSACNSTIRATSFDLRQQVSNCALHDLRQASPESLRTGTGERNGVTKRMGCQAPP